MSAPSDSSGSDCVLPYSPSQLQVWLDQQSYPDSSHLNTGGTATVFGAIDYDLLEKSLATLVAQSESLRLKPLPDGTQQLIDQWPGPLLDIEDLSQQDNVEAVVEQKTRLEMDVQFPLDGQTRPWRIFLWKMDEHRHTMWIKFHHAVIDGYSGSTLLKQWSDIYNAMQAGETPSATDGPSYRAFIAESQEYLASDAYTQDGEYWRELMPELPPPLLKRRCNNTKDGELPQGFHHYYPLPREQYGALEAFAKSQRVTTYHLFVAALAVYFCRTCQRQELVIGVPVLNRRGKRFKTTLGMFSMVVPLRITIEPGQSLGVLLKQVSTKLRAAYRHARYPLNNLVRDCNLFDTGRDNMFDIYLSFEPYGFDVSFGDAHLSTTRQLFATKARYPLLVNVCEFHQEGPVELVYESSAAYLTPRETEQLADRLNHLLQQMMHDPEADIDYLPLMAEEERYDLLVAKHADIPSHAEPKPFIEIFEHLAALNPHAVAMRWLEGEMDYATFNVQANRLARVMKTKGVEAGQLVAVIAPRLPQTLIAFFAIAKLGCAFLPIDPEADTARIERLLEHCQSPLVLLTEADKTMAEQMGFDALAIDGEHSPLIDETLDSHNLATTIDPDALALVLFTSGSTGDPKGVMMAHSGLTRRMAWLARTFNITPSDIALQSIQLTFDPSLIEILLPLTHGGSVALPPPGKLAPTEVARYAEHFGATYISIVPTIMRYVCQTADAHPNLKLKVVACGGEVLHTALAQAFVEKTGSDIYNVWGLTETTIFATAYRFEPNQTKDPIAVGEPIDDTTIYILDDNLQPLPTGVTGEIYIGGNALSLGYLNAPELTAAKFIDNPFEPGNRLFKSGDLGRWDSDGQLQFVSRIDNMVKIRGQRVEPSQVESALCGLSFVAAAAVKPVDGELHAWIEPKNAFPDEHLPVLESSLKEGLLKRLPAYMVPSGFTQLDALPRQVGGKLDYQSLIPDPIHLKAARMAQRPEAEPATDLERILLKLWQDALKDDSLNVESDFFSQGGSSIEALNLLSQIDKQLNHRLPLAVLLKNPTVKALARAIVHRHQPLQVSLSDSPGEVPIYLAASGHGDAMRFKPLAKALEGGYHIHMLQPPLPDDFITYKSIDELAQHYAALIELQEHTTPPILTGFSIGGVVALETARRLISRGYSIDALVLIDTTYPAWLIRRTPLWKFCGYLVEKLGLQELSINQRTLGSLFGDPGLKGQISVLGSYQPKPLEYPVTLVISSGLKRWYSRFLRPWRKLFGDNLKEQHLPGFHGTLFNPEHVDKLAEVIVEARQHKK